MKCWKCDALVDVPPKIPFKAICDECGSWLHVCVNCKFYKIGMSNDCMIPETELITDREAANYCDEFQVKEEITTQQSVSPSQVAADLFGEKTDQRQQVSPSQAAAELFGEKTKKEISGSDSFNNLF